MQRSPVLASLILVVAMAACTNTTTRTSGGSTTVDATTTPAWISAALHRFDKLAADDGDEHPSSIRYVRTTEGLAEASILQISQQSGDRTSQEVVVIEAEGRFTGQLMKGPPQPPGQVSHVMIAVYEKTTGNLVDWAFAETPVALGSVGNVVQARTS